MTNMGGEERCIRCLFGKPEGKRPLGKPRHRWEDNIGMYRKEISWKGMDWIDLAVDRDRWQAVVNMVMILMFYRFHAIVFHIQVLFPATTQASFYTYILPLPIVAITGELQYYKGTWSVSYVSGLETYMH
jgi:hypothetical protein